LIPLDQYLSKLAQTKPANPKKKKKNPANPGHSPV